jgi:glycosyltransferase involved in cell wall biosynthesis
MFSDSRENRSSKPSISVVIPCYNEELFIAACLDSLKVQDFPRGFEIIVVDNNSSDQTSRIARKCGARVIYEPRRGVCAAREAGTRAALGDIVVSTDADNVFPTNWLSEIWDGFSKDTGTVAVAGPCRFVDAPRWGRSSQTFLFWSIELVYRLTGKVWYVTACNTAFRKSIFPGYNTKMTQGGDEFDFLRRLNKTGKIAYVPDNYIFTSSRRLRRGMFYGMVITLLWYYAANYAVSTLIGKSLSIFSWPAFRQEQARDRWLFLKQASVAMVLALTFFVFQAHNTFAHDAFVDTREKIVSTGHTLSHLAHHVPKVSWNR